MSRLSAAAALTVVLLAVAACAPASAILASAPGAAASASSSASTPGSATSAPEEPQVLGLPPATSDIAVAPVVELVAPATALVAPVNPLIASTGSTDGAVSVDESKEKQAFTLAGDVFFEPTSAVLTARAQDELTAIATRLGELSPNAVTVVGHTDDVDTDAYNQDLSERRAQAVREFLLKSVPDLPVTAQGRGESEPVASNETDEGRALNRRVEIVAEGA